MSKGRCRGVAGERSRLLTWLGGRGKALPITPSLSRLDWCKQYRDLVLLSHSIFRYLITVHNNYRIIRGVECLYNAFVVVVGSCTCNPRATLVAPSRGMVIKVGAYSSIRASVLFRLVGGLAPTWMGMAIICRVHISSGSSS